jgi:hypothetical protein
MFDMGGKEIRQTSVDESYHLLILGEQNHLLHDVIRFHHFSWTVMML